MKAKPIDLLMLLLIAALTIGTVAQHQFTQYLMLCLLSGAALGQQISRTFKP